VERQAGDRSAAIWREDRFASNRKKVKSACSPEGQEIDHHSKGDDHHQQTRLAHEGSNLYVGLTGDRAPLRRRTTSAGGEADAMIAARGL